MARTRDLREIRGTAPHILVLLLVTSMALASFLAACATDVDERSRLTNGTGGREEATQNNPLTDDNGDDPDLAGLAADAKAKDLFNKNVQPELTRSCGGCHAQGPGPAWIVPADVEKSYAFMFNRGYVVKASALVKKGIHSSGGAPALTPPQTKTVIQWIALELKERGDKAPPSVLDKLGDCLDKDKFAAIGLGKLLTATRNAQNNPNKYTENANECTGCKPTTCNVCHSADPGSGFVMAMGNDILPADTTFNETKSTAPPYLQKYFGLDTTGTPIPSKALKAKSDATVQGKPYSHPMYTIPPAVETALDAFVADAIAKYKAGTCGKN
jgi:hypothetical protein